jgi:hypothetical protein
VPPDESGVSLFLCRGRSAVGNFGRRKPGPSDGVDSGRSWTIDEGGTDDAQIGAAGCSAIELDAERVNSSACAPGLTDLDTQTSTLSSDHKKADKELGALRAQFG